jgi:hypothetical protein
MLPWNSEEVLDISASLLRSGEEYRTLDLPVTPQFTQEMILHAEHILKEGRGSVSPLGLYGEYNPIAEATAGLGDRDTLLRCEASR